MWQRLPLSYKQIISLLIVQISALIIGSFWLSHWVDKTRIEELKRVLDTQSDVVEGQIKIERGHLYYDRTNEIGRELDSEHNIYFLLTDDTGEIIAESQGPSAETRLKMQNVLLKAKPEHEAVHMIEVGEGHWLIQKERIDRNDDHQTLKGIVHIALDAEPVLKEGMRFKRYFFLAASFTLLLTALGTGCVVSFSTKNLTIFARQLKTIRPPRFDGQIHLTPHSAEEKLLFDSYKEMIAAVKASAEAQRLFIAHASHELKSPIAASLSAFEVMLSRPRSTAEYEATSREIFKEIKVLRRLSDALLDLAKLDGDSVPTGSEEICDVFDILHLVKDRWQKQAEQKEIEIALELSKCDERFGPGTREQWEVILGNIVDNAIKYGKKHGKITVTGLLNRAGCAEIKIQDNGIGMSDDELARLGDVFYRADESRNDSNSFGLGFAHAKRLASQLGCKVDVVSERGQGTTVTVTLPKYVAA